MKRERACLATPREERPCKRLLLIAWIAAASCSQLFVRKNKDGTIKYAISDAPADTPFKALCKVSLMRRAIRHRFQEGKSRLGMNHYEHRSWPAWHRHMIYVFLALDFLMRLRIRLKKSPNVDTPAGPATAGSSTTAEIPDAKRCHANRPLSHETKSGGL